MHNLWLLTHHLELLAASKCLSRLEVRSLGDLGKRLECRVSGEWREIMPLELAQFFADQLDEYAEDAGWWNWFGVTHEPERVLAVSVGFRGWPHEGRVRIAYSVAPEFRGRGLATEAGESLCQWAFSHGVQTVTSQMEETNYAARRVLEKCGFTLCRSERDTPDGPLTLYYERDNHSWN